eukprot:TRINITY_DN919_c0_g1_i1.p1 TRINITY_DN919_c0_g1~~TRINITY_DN919_c0_g1_i1.p1  ORF type:complete len:191 (-),score=20.80 TRINITY_DN919_c0_g1_i1:90-662(-)
MSENTMLRDRTGRAGLEVPKVSPPLHIKIISMGDAGVGKSCLIKRYCEDRFISKYISTIGVDYGVKKVFMDDHEVKVNFWDLAGMPDFVEVRNEFYKDTQGGILVYDVGSRKSFENLDMWVKEATKYGAKDITIAVCANKIDQGQRSVSEKEGRSYAQSRGYMYFETSANTGEYVKVMFNGLFEKVIASR